MGLHQAITDKNTAEPCDCGADDDHHVYSEAESEDQLVDYDDEAQRVREELITGFQRPLDEEDDVEDE